MSRCKSNCCVLAWRVFYQQGWSLLSGGKELGLNICHSQSEPSWRCFVNFPVSKLAAPWALLYPLPGRPRRGAPFRGHDSILGNRYCCSALLSAAQIVLERLQVSVCVQVIVHSARNLSCTVSIPRAPRYIHLLTVARPTVPSFGFVLGALLSFLRYCASVNFVKIKYPGGVELLKLADVFS